MLGLLRRFRRLLGGAPRVDVLAGLQPEGLRLIVGLGNPGDKYAGTRHNLGFRCVETIAERCRVAWTDRRHDLHSLVTVARPDDAVQLVLAKPQTFMNNSGIAVVALLEQLQLPTERCLVVYDDMDLAFGSLRLRERGSPGTHNGMRSVVSALASEDIPRLRVGISQPRRDGAISHVLSEFAPEERALADELVARAADAALDWARAGAVVAMNRYNAS